MSEKLRDLGCGAEAPEQSDVEVVVFFVPPAEDGGCYSWSLRDQTQGVFTDTWSFHLVLIFLRLHRGLACPLCSGVNLVGGKPNKTRTNRNPHKHLCGNDWLKIISEHFGKEVVTLCCLLFHGVSVI